MTGHNQAARYMYWQMKKSICAVNFLFSLPYPVEPLTVPPVGASPNFSKLSGE